MKRLNWVFLWLIVPGLCGCDTFFAVHGVVTDANTGNPILGATVTLVLDEGVEEPDTTITTGTDGLFDILINEHSSAWAILTVDKDGYDAWSTQFRGRPKCGIGVHLIPKETKKIEP